MVVRNYEARDHADVCRIFKEGMHENWWPAYRFNLLQFMMPTYRVFFFTGPPLKKLKYGKLRLGEVRCI